MSELIKDVGDKVTEELLKGLTGKHIHVPSNPHVTQTPTGAKGTVNAWFGGKVAGYEKAYVAYDYQENVFLEEPKVFYQMLLCDGMGYVLSDEAEMYVITEDEFLELVAENDAETMLEDIVRRDDKEVFVPDNSKILLPDNDKIVLPNGQGIPGTNEDKGRIINFPGKLKEDN